MRTGIDNTRISRSTFSSFFHTSIPLVLGTIKQCCIVCTLLLIIDFLASTLKGLEMLHERLDGLKLDGDKQQEDLLQPDLQQVKMT